MLEELLVVLIKLLIHLWILQSISYSDGCIITSQNEWKGDGTLGFVDCEGFFSFLFLYFEKKPKYSLTGNQVQLIQGSPSKAHLSNFMPHWDDTSCFLQGDSLLHNITQQTDATGHAKLTCLNSGNSEKNVALAETCIVKKGGVFLYHSLLFGKWFIIIWWWWSLPTFLGPLVWMARSCFNTRMHAHAHFFFSPSLIKQHIILWLDRRGNMCI